MESLHAQRNKNIGLRATEGVGWRTYNFNRLRCVPIAGFWATQRSDNERADSVFKTMSRARK
jgi:hypothetical protein